MGLEIITDQLIENLLASPKVIENPKARKKRDSGNEPMAMQKPPIAFIPWKVHCIV